MVLNQQQKHKNTKTQKQFFDNVGADLLVLKVAVLKIGTHRIFLF